MAAFIFVLAVMVALIFGGFVMGYLVLPAVERAIEFFMPLGQSGESQQWITSSMRMLSLAARGGFLERALRDMRKVAWDRGPVRLGSYTKQDGSKVPLWHDSEVAAIAYALQQIIAQRQQLVRGCHFGRQLILNRGERVEDHPERSLNRPGGDRRRGFPGLRPGPRRLHRRDRPRL